MERKTVAYRLDRAGCHLISRFGANILSALGDNKDDIVLHMANTEFVKVHFPVDRNQMNPNYFLIKGEGARRKIVLFDLHIFFAEIRKKHFSGGSWYRILVGGTCKFTV